MVEECYNEETMKNWAFVLHDHLVQKVSTILPGSFIVALDGWYNGHNMWMVALYAVCPLTEEDKLMPQYNDKINKWLFLRCTLMENDAYIPTCKNSW